MFTTIKKKTLQQRKFEKMHGANNKNTGLQGKRDKHICVNGGFSFSATLQRHEENAWRRLKLDVPTDVMSWLCGGSLWWKVKPVLRRP